MVECKVRLFHDCTRYACINQYVFVQCAEAQDTKRKLVLGGGNDNVVNRDKVVVRITQRTIRSDVKRSWILDESRRKWFDDEEHEYLATDVKRFRSWENVRVGYTRISRKVPGRI